MINRINNIAKINGYHGVRLKAQEELQELIEAIEENVESNIIDETADCLIMLFQLMYVYGNEKAVYDRIDYKLDRTEKLFKEEK